MLTRGAGVTHVVGARPNLMKAAPVIDALRAHHVRQRVIHTGQHYDALLSDVFFEELRLPVPDANLGVGSGTHAEQTAAAMVGVERCLVEDRPALCVVYGDVNSTLAAALAAAKVSVPVAHVEAGLRSFDPTMPEETNRRLTDALSDLLFVTSEDGLVHLDREGVDPGRVHLVGNSMIDSLLRVRDGLDPQAALRRIGVPAQGFGLVTLHRPSNVDDPERAHAVVAALVAVSRRIPLVVPLHPRGRQQLEQAGLRDGSGIQIVETLGYGDFVSLMTAAAVVITDSGGVQEETTVLGVPCLTMRPNTERPITLTRGTNRLVEPHELLPCVTTVLDQPPHSRALTSIPLWDGRAGQRIAEVIGHHLLG